MAVGLRGMEFALEVGERILLRYPVASDRDEYIALMRSSREHMKPWEPERPSGYDAWGDDTFDREMQHRNTDVGERWVICRIEDGALVGRLAITGIERGPFQNGRFGYWIGAAHLRKGYMTEALRLGVRRCFSAMGLHRVSASVMPRNEASLRALKSVGFERVGLSPRYLKIAGVWEDHEHWAITAEMIDGPWTEGSDQA